MKKRLLFQSKGGHSRYFLIPGLCILLLACCIGGVFSYYRHTTEQEFSSMVDTTLNAYITTQKEHIQSTIEKTTNTLNAFASLIGQGGNQEFINAYLQALNDNESDVYFLYTNTQEFEQYAASGQARSEDLANVELLKHNKTVISQITYSEHNKNAYWFAIGVPVFEDNKFIGALRGVLNAEMLVSTAQYPPAQGTIKASLLCDEAGNIIPVHADKSDPEGTIYSYIKNTQTEELSGTVMNQIEHVLQSESQVTHSVTLSRDGDIPNYISITDLDLHDWHLVIFLRADMTAAHSATIIRNTMVASTILVGAVLLVCIVLIYFFSTLQKRLKAEERRYLLLEQFSDTVLFDYDFRFDTMKFTPNAKGLFRTGALVQSDFSVHLDSLRVYEEDRSTITAILTGGKESGEFQLRLLRPEKEEYFWCQVQYRFLYENSRPLSIVGKITDISQQKQQEDRLIELSQLDGLTRLYNKLAATKKIQALLAEGTPGLLFMFDLDDFKQINDQYGHLAGDEALRYVGDCMRKTFRSTDILGRIGGDELVAFMPSLPEKNDAVMDSKMKTFQDLLCQYNDTHESSISVSVGIASAPAHGTTYQELYHAADQAMYQAKQQGKNCFRRCAE